MEIKMGPVMGKAPAIIGSVEVRPGQSVRAGQILAQVETGKGNRPVKSPSDGQITDVLCQVGDSVCSGQNLFLLQELSTDENTLKKPITTDLLIIGGGPGGYVAALYAAKQGLSVILAEKGLLGGTCLNCGCIPTKALIQSARLYQSIKEAATFGIHTTDVFWDSKEIFNRKDRICQELRDGIEGLLLSNHVTVLKGSAQLTGERTAIVLLQNGEQEISFQNVILATGSQPSIPAFLNESSASSASVIDSEKALSAGTFPKSVAIIGGGVIGMEFAFLYKNLGAQVYVIEYMNQVLGNVDSDVAEAVKKAALEEGIHIYTDAKVTSLSGMDSGHTMVAFEYESATHTLAVETVLTATGRKPVTTGLGLKKAGVSLTDRGAVKTNDSMETNIHGIYAIGDLTGKLPLAHVASHQGIAAVDVICGKSRTIDYDAIPSVIFTHPEAACVGKTEKQCKELNIPFKVSTFPFAANGKAKIMGEAEGFVKLIRSEESGKILGGAIVGPDASALISTITAAVHTEMTDKDLIDMVFAHPTTSEAIYEAGLGLSIGPLHYQR